MCGNRLCSCLIVFLMAAFFSSMGSEAAGHLLKKGEYLSQARPALLRAGWRPVETYFRTYRGEFEHARGDAEALFSAGYIEVEFCGCCDVVPCVFNYAKGNRCLQVFTRGEYDPGPRNGPVVASWAHDCPKKED